MSDFTGETKDGTQGNIEELMRFFPRVVTEAKDGNGRLVRSVDFAALRELLGDDTSENDERYDFTWAGKKEAMREAARPTRKTLRPCKEESKNWDTTRNLYIEGDNLEALKILENTYHGQVKMIYIDPPYNTGKDFIYHDNFHRSQQDENLLSGVVDEETAEQFSVNPESNGRYHSDWCSMMYPRLVMAHKLLRDDGIIFISIDDNEVVNMRRICDEIFGEDNLLSVHNIQVRYGQKSLNEKKDFQELLEYVLIYAKNKIKVRLNKPKEEYPIEKFDLAIQHRDQPDLTVTENGRIVDVWKPGNFRINKVAPHLEGFKETWISGSILTGTGHGAIYLKCIDKRRDVDGDGCLYRIHGVGEDGLGYRYYTNPTNEKSSRGKMYTKIPLDVKGLIERGEAKKENPIINYYDFSGDFGNIRMEGGVAFNAGKKPVKMLKQFINYFAEKDVLILDFFSGSSSTAHAAMQQNSEDSGSRKFVMIQLPEICGSDDETGKSEFANICELGKERIRRAGEKILAEWTEKQKSRENELALDGDGAAGVRALPPDIGFRVFKVSDSNMEDVFYSPNEVTQTMLPGMVNNVKEGRTGLDLLISTRLEWGLSIDCPIDEETVDGKTVFSVDGGQMLACFETGITDAFVKKLAMRKPQFAIFRDVDFKDSAAKINAREIFKAVCGKDAPTEVRFL